LVYSSLTTLSVKVVSFTVALIQVTEKFRLWVSVWPGEDWWTTYGNWSRFWKSFEKSFHWNCICWCSGL